MVVQALPHCCTSHHHHHHEPGQQHHSTCPPCGGGCSSACGAPGGEREREDISISPSKGNHVYSTALTTITAVNVTKSQHSAGILHTTYILRVLHRPCLLTHLSQHHPVWVCSCVLVLAGLLERLTGSAAVESPALSASGRSSISKTSRTLQDTQTGKAPEVSLHYVVCSRFRRYGWVMGEGYGRRHSLNSQCSKGSLQRAHGLCWQGLKQPVSTMPPQLLH